MKYCTKCGAQMSDDALFCPKCGTKAAMITEEHNEPVKEEPIVEEAPKKTRKYIKSPAKPLHEQTLKEFLPMSLAIIVCTLVFWIVQGLVHPTGILRIMPFIVFLLIGGSYGVVNIRRAMQCYKKEIYFNAALSLVLAVILITCSIVDIILMIVGR